MIATLPDRSPTLEQCTDEPADARREHSTTAAAPVSRAMPSPTSQVRQKKRGAGREGERSDPPSRPDSQMGHGPARLASARWLDRCVTSHTVACRRGQITPSVV